MKLWAGFGGTLMPTDGISARGLPMPPMLPWPKPKPVPGRPIWPSMAASATIAQ